MSKTPSPSASKAYGIVRVCAAWGIARSTHYQRCKPRNLAPKRPGPKGFHSDEELRRHIRRTIEESPVQRGRLPENMGQTAFPEDSDVSEANASNHAREWSSGLSENGQSSRSQSP